ncbi:MAG TPA: hypothetical protein VIS48_16365 [Candidatus Kryptonia bacterium]
MKAISFIVVSFFISMSACAQEQTLISGPIESGGYGGPAVRFSTIDNHFAVMVGGYGGWLINHTFLLGGGGYGLVNSISAPQAATLYYSAGQDFRFNFGYGGLFLEYIGAPDNLFHFSISTLIGAGGVGYGYWNNYSNSLWGISSPTSAFFVLEPGAGVELNITPFFRLNAGGSYRLVRGSDLVGITDSELSDLSIYLTFKFGKF